MIRLKGTSRTYRQGRTIVVRALRNVDLEIEQGEFVAIIGPSGSGKSTLLHLLGFLDHPDEGAYHFMGRAVTGLGAGALARMRNRSIGFVFQQFHLLPRNTAVQNVMLPLIYSGRGHLKETARAKMIEVGLEHRIGHRPNELSGGEQQRVAIARALVNDPMLILADEPTGNLDTKSGEEIVALLKKLHGHGKTVIMVTHEKEIASHADRLIEMRDGSIVADTRVRDTAAFRTENGREDQATGKSWGHGTAEIGDHLRQAFRAILAHKLRSVLSMLGMLIGVGSVIAMLAITLGAKADLQDRLAALGSNLLIVSPAVKRMHGVAIDSGGVTRFTLEDAEAMKKLPSVRKVSPAVHGWGQIVYGNKNCSAGIEGAGPDYAEMRACVPEAGRFLTAQEVRSREKVVVLGRTVVTELFGESNPLGRTVKINRINFRVIGVLPPRGGHSRGDNDNIVIVPVTTGMYRLLGKQYVDYVNVEVKGPQLVDSAKTELSELVAKRHRFPPDSEETVRIFDLTEIRNMFGATTRTMGWLLGSIAAIALLVGGIGIMNIMLVSVTERTREIGLRKAVGARAGDIMVQFLIESIVMTAVGGILGICLGQGGAYLLGRLADWTISTSASAITLAVAFSAVIGLMFGLWPARQAAKLDPIRALKYE